MFDTDSGPVSVPVFHVRNSCGDDIHEGDTITDFRGDHCEFVRVTRGTEYNGTAKVLVATRPDGFRMEYYATVFALTITTED